jgi:hypothetical protein
MSPAKRTIATPATADTISPASSLQPLDLVPLQAALQTFALLEMVPIVDEAHARQELARAVHIGFVADLRLWTKTWTTCVARSSRSVRMRLADAWRNSRPSAIVPEPTPRCSVCNRKRLRRSSTRFTTKLRRCLLAVTTSCCRKHPQPSSPCHAWRQSGRLRRRSPA